MRALDRCSSCNGNSGVGIRRLATTAPSSPCWRRPARRYSEELPVAGRDPGARRVRHMQRRAVPTAIVPHLEPGRSQSMRGFGGAMPHCNAWHYRDVVGEGRRSEGHVELGSGRTIL